MDTEEKRQKLTGDLGFRRGGDSGVVHGEVLEVPRGDGDRDKEQGS
jgi:hypothetical protein